MTTAVLSVLAASLVGSPHCAGMCGGLAYLAAPGPAPPRRLVAGYHGARLAGYVGLGALSGTLGSGMNRLGAVAGAGRAAAVLAGAAMLGMGMLAMARALGAPIPRLVRLPVGGPWTRVTAHVTRWSPGARAAGIGLVSALLPCGWLYAFVVMAAATGGPLGGAALMAVFWLGTLPVFALIALTAQQAAGPLRRYLPLATGGVLVVVGAFTMLNRGAGMHARHAAGAAAPAAAPAANPATGHDGHGR